MKNKGFVSIIVIILIIVLIIGGVIFGVIYNNKGEKENSKEEESKEVVISEKCQDFKDDVCDLFSCVVESCWCGNGPSPVLAEMGEQVTKEEEATKVVSDYLKSVDSEYIYNIRAVKINDLFYNVFSYDKDGDEQALTISFNGKIIKTVCGV